MARRTVVKYREAQKILSSRQRRDRHYRTWSPPSSPHARTHPLTLHHGAFASAPLPSALLPRLKRRSGARRIRLDLGRIGILCV